jgi:DNA ligase (NAD+)
MYSAEEQKRFEKLTKEFIGFDEKNAKNIEAAAKQITDLRDTIIFHDHRYYVETEPIASDYEYDKLFRLLKAIEIAHPELQDPDSPTQRVALGLTKDFPTVAHLVPMLSLDNSYDEADLKDFDRKVRELSGREQITYHVELKYDGGSVSLIYEDDKLVRGATRGDGVMGEEVTPNIKTIRSIPLKADFSKHGIKTIEIRGEVLIAKARFEKYNQEREEAGLPRLANPRNSAAGTMRIKDKAEVLRRGLEAVVYHISYAVDKDGNDLLGTEVLKTRSQNTELLHSLGFKTPIKEHAIYNSIDDVVEYCHRWAEKRDKFPFEIDGMVVKVDDLELEEKLGATAHHPRWAIAFKFTARNATTKLLQVDFQVGRVGTITPVAKVSPVGVGGVTVTSASMFNEDFIKSKDIRVGDTVVVERAGDVIPYIASVVTEARTGEEKPIEFPTHCPSCGEPLEREEAEAAWRCVNFSCPAQVQFRLQHFVSKDAMDIGGLGKANVERFIQEGWLNTPVDIFRLPYEKIGELEGFGEKSVEKLKAAIEESKSRPIHKLLFGLGIRYVGETTARNLAENVKCLDEFFEWDMERINALEGVGPTMAESIYQFFQNETNRKLIRDLAAEGVQICRTEKERTGDEGPLSGLTLLFTGTLQTMGRSEAKEKAENAGGTVANSLSSKVDYLVVGEDPGSKVDKAKKLATVKIITEEEFLGMLR